MSEKTFEYHSTAEGPPAQLWLKAEDRSLIDFSAGYTFSFKIGSPGSAAVLTKTSGITGAAGSGSEPTGVPNVSIAWSSGELDLTEGVYRWQLTATSGGDDQVFEGLFVVKPVIT